MLEQIQPSRWSPTAWSSGTLLKKDHPRLAGGFNSVELVSAAATASIFVLDCPRCTGRGARGVRRAGGLGEAARDG